jgi:N-acetylglucosaminyl-diphospho-decaprenol L-rhamnosyltransferase
MITVSIISHGHGSMIPRLLRSLLGFPEVGKVILTLNIPEEINFDSNDRVLIIRNNSPKGFGENNNAAFQFCVDEYFCIINPDVILSTNPYPFLIQALIDPNVGLVGPKVLNERGLPEDSARHFITPTSIFMRHFLNRKNEYSTELSDKPFFSEWIAGMFMLFKRSAYLKLKGFDEKFFLYVEDTDICTRAWLLGYRVMVAPSAMVVHEARRATLKSWRHLGWHVRSLIRYYLLYLGRLSKISSSIKSLEA